MSSIFKTFFGVTVKKLRIFSDLSIFFYFCGAGARFIKVYFEIHQVSLYFKMMELCGWNSGLTDGNN